MCACITIISSRTNVYYKHMAFCWRLLLRGPMTNHDGPLYLCPPIARGSCYTVVSFNYYTRDGLLLSELEMKFHGFFSFGVLWLGTS